MKKCILSLPLVLKTLKYARHILARLAIKYEQHKLGIFRKTMRNIHHIILMVNYKGGL